MSLAMALGAGIGLGLAMIARGLRPPRPALTQALVAPYRSPSGQPAIATGGHSGLLVRLGLPLARVLGRQPASIAFSSTKDLPLVTRTAEQHLAEKIVCALLGFLLLPAVVAVLDLAGVALPLVAAMLPALVLAAAGFFAPDLAVRSEATKRRLEMRYALSPFIDLTGIALAGGSGVEGALRSAAEVGCGAAFHAIRLALERARLTRTTPWAALEQLGRDMGVSELEELSASVGLAGTEGARVRQSLAARAASLRARRRSDAEAQARAATQRMSVTLVLLLIGFLAFVLFPAYVRVFASL